jgi:hypothetical protein
MNTLSVNATSGRGCDVGTEAAKVSGVGPTPPTTDSNACRTVPS